MIPMDYPYLTNITITVCEYALDGIGSVVQSAWGGKSPRQQHVHGRRESIAEPILLHGEEGLLILGCKGSPPDYRSCRLETQGSVLVILHTNNNGRIPSTKRGGACDY